MRKRNLIKLAIILMSIGFAASSTFIISKSVASIGENKNDFSIIFTNAILDGKNVYSSALDSTKQKITFTTSDLKQVNQKSVLDYEITNNSVNYDADVTINCSTKKGTEAKYTSIKNELENNSVTIKAKSSVNGRLTITLNKASLENVVEEYICSLEFVAKERDTLGKEEIPEPIAFATDSWKTIKNAVQSGNTGVYKVGDEKKIELDNLGTQTIRIANKSECTTETSETACGFVIEFSNIPIQKNMNESRTNVGGWASSLMRTYLNQDFYLLLPESLSDMIIDTKVISGHGKTTGETNFETTDKIYLLSNEEVFGGTNTIDTSVGTSRQLDYYKNLGITETNYTNSIKNFNGSASSWWLRSADKNRTTHFLDVDATGDPDYVSSNNNLGVSPAFRI